MSGAKPQPIEDGRFEVKKDGIDAVILFPSLGTPALVDTSKKLTVIVAVHDNSMNKLKELDKKRKGYTPGDAVGVDGAVIMHSHLYLVDWGRNHPHANTEQTYLGHFQDLTLNRHLIYQSHTRARERFTQKEVPDYKVWYLGELKEKNVNPLHIYTREGGNTPFGNLADSAVKLYQEHKYTHLFQLEFYNFEEANLAGKEKELKELVWVWGDAAGVFSTRSDTYEKPGDTVLLTNWEKNLGTEENGGGGWFTKGEPVLKKDPTYERIYRTRDAWISNSNEELSMYSLLNPGSRSANKPYQKDKLPAASQKDTHFLLARHPVFICTKQHLEIGVVGDMHVSIRQALYTQTNCQVIPGAPLEDSPNIGLSLNEFLASSREILTAVCKQCDVLFIAGDIIDHDRNMHPGRCADEISRTGQLWQKVNYSDAKNKKYYPRFIDSIVVHELLLLCMDQGTPVYFVTGNHEGYEEPYGISPRAGISPEAHGAYGHANFLANAGIPCDHNLTIYEAVLLYGEHYHKCQQLPQNFNDDVISRYYQWFTPWHDVVVPYLKNNYIFFGWGKKEGYVKTSFAGGKSLPRAYSCMSDAQLKLLVYAASDTAKKNVLCSHFTYIAYDTALPLKDANNELLRGKVTFEPSTVYAAGQAVSEAYTVLEPASPAMFGLGALGESLKAAGKAGTAYCATNIGSFTEKLHETWSLLAENRIHYTISGHTHRSCVYSVDRQHAANGWADKTLKPYSDPESVQWNTIDKFTASPAPTVTVAPAPFTGERMPRVFTLAPNGANMIVAGSAGPMSGQNVEGEFGGYGMDKPQGLIFSQEKNTVSVVRTGGTKPRLAAVAGAIQVIGGEFPFGTNYGSTWLYDKFQTGKIYFGNVVTTTWGGQYYIDVNEKWIKTFGSVPFAYLKLYVVVIQEREPLAIPFQFNVDQFEKNRVYFKEYTDDFYTYLEDIRWTHPGAIETEGAFLTMHFDKGACKSRFIENYDTSHPLIFCVKLQKTPFLRHSEIVMSTNDIPPFKFYKRFEEYSNAKDLGK